MLGFLVVCTGMWLLEDHFFSLLDADIVVRSKSSEVQEMF